MRGFFVSKKFITGQRLFLKAIRARVWYSWRLGKHRRNIVTTLYGIKNCDTVKKARKWLAERNIEFIFHDVRADGLELAQINSWIEKSDWETVLNRRGTTWRKLDQSLQKDIARDNVAALLLANPTMIKRPILDHNGTINVGFKPDIYESIFSY